MVSGTEVFHRRCTSGIETSNSRRLEQDVLRAQRDLELSRRAHREARQEQQRASETAREVIATAKISPIAAEIATARLDSITRENLNIRNLLAAERQQVAALRRELEAARTELALHQTLGPLPGQSQQATTSNPEGKDDTELRFAMLELD